MLTRDQVARKILKLRALAARPGSEAEGDAAREAAATLMRDYGITADDLRLRAEVDQATTGPDRAAEQARAEPRRGPPSSRPVAARAVATDHALHPNRVHLAYDYESSVCGVRPTFVWVHTRDKLLTFDDPCPHCIVSGVLDTRTARKRLGPA